MNGFLRLQPRQRRGQETMLRLLAAARHLAREGGIASVTVAQAARHAQVTPQAAYRYFADNTQLLQALAALMQERSLRFLCRKIERAHFANLNALAEFLVDYVARYYLYDPQLPVDVMQSMLHAHQAVSGNAIRDLSVCVLAAIHRDRLAGAHLLRADDVATILAGLAGAAYMIASRDPADLTWPRYHQVLKGQVIGGFVALSCDPEGRAA